MGDKEVEDQAADAVEDAQQRAYMAARKIAGQIGAGYARQVINAARLKVIEMTLASMFASSSECAYDGTPVAKSMMELRDYWLEVEKEISKK